MIQCSTQSVHHTHCKVSLKINVLSALSLSRGNTGDPINMWLTIGFLTGGKEGGNNRRDGGREGRGRDAFSSRSVNASIFGVYPFIMSAPHVCYVR